MSGISTSTLQNILSLAQNAATSGSNWVPVYQAIINALSTTVDDPFGGTAPVTYPNAGTDEGVLTWLNGAMGVNGNTGAFADYIRSYTSDQYQLRSGMPLDLYDPSLLQTSSNDIAANVASQFLFGRPATPDSTNPKPVNWSSPPPFSSDNSLNLEQIGTYDASAAASVIFRNAASSTGANNDSPWAGTVLFTDLGVSKYFNDWILDMDANSKDGGAKVESGTYDLIAATEATIQSTTKGRYFYSLITGQGLQLGELQLENNGAIQQAENAAQTFFATAYGSDFQSNDVGGILFGTAAISALKASNTLYEVGTIAGESWKLDPTTKVFDGGPNNNTVYAGPVVESDTPSVANIIDGGSGSANVLDYSSNGAPTNITLQNQGYWQLRLQIAPNGNYNTQDAYEFSALNLSGNGDKVIWGSGLTPSNVLHGTSTTGGSMAITEKPTDPGALNTVDLSNLAGSYVFNNGAVDGLGVTFSGFSTLKGPTSGQHTFNITPTENSSSFTTYQAGCASDTFNVTYSDPHASPLLLADDPNGNDTFTFKNADKAAFTVVYAGGGGDTLDFDVGSNATANVVELDMSGVTASNIADLDVSKIENYVDGQFSAPSNAMYDPLAGSLPTFVVINPTATDKLEYNDQLVGSPTAAITGTSQISTEKSGYGSNQSLYQDEGVANLDTNIYTNNGIIEGVQTLPVSPNNIFKILTGSYNPNSPYDIASISNEWITSTSSTTNYSLLSGNTILNPTQGYAGGASVPVLSLSTLGTYTTSSFSQRPLYLVAGYESGSSSSYSYSTAGQLNLLNFGNGDFGIGVSGGQPESVETTGATTAYEVTSWASADVDPITYNTRQNAPPYVGAILGTAPASLGKVVASDSSPGGTKINSGTLGNLTASPLRGLSVFDFLTSQDSSSSSSSSSSPSPSPSPGNSNTNPPIDVNDYFNTQPDQTASVAIQDTAANVSSALDVLNSDPRVSSISLTDAGTPNLQLDSFQALNDGTALKDITNASFTIGVLDSAADVSASFAALSNDPRIASIDLTDSGTPALSMTASNALDDTALLGKIVNPSYTITIVDTAANILNNQKALATEAKVAGAIVDDNAADVLQLSAQLKSCTLIKSIDVADSAASVLGAQTQLNASASIGSETVIDSAANVLSQAVALSGDSAIAAVVVSDSAAQVSAHIDALASDPAIKAIMLTGQGTPTLGLTVGQALNDTSALQKIVNPTYAVTVNDTAANVQTSIDALRAVTQVNAIDLTNTAPVTFALTAAQCVNDAATLAKIANTNVSISIVDTASDVASNIDALANTKSVASVTLEDLGVPKLALTAQQVAADGRVLTEITNPNVSITVADTAADVSSAFNVLAADPTITAITLTGANTPRLALNVSQALNDAATLAKITNGSYDPSVQDSAATILSNETALGRLLNTSLTVADTAANVLSNTTAILADAQITSVSVVDSATNVSAQIDALSKLGNVGSVVLTDSGSPTLTLNASQLTNDGNILGAIQNSSYSTAVSDTAANISANIDAMNAKNISSIHLTDSATPQLNLSVAQALDDTAVLNAITSPGYKIAVYGSVANVLANISQLKANSHIASISIEDTASHISAAFDALNALPSLSSITISDGAQLQLTAAQALNDTAALSIMAQPSSIEIVDNAADVLNNFGKLSQDSKVGNIQVVDTAASLLQNASAIKSDVRYVSGQANISSIEAADTASNILNNANALETTFGNVTLDVADTATNIAANLPALLSNSYVSSISTTDGKMLVLTASEAVSDEYKLQASDMTQVVDNAADISSQLDSLNYLSTIASINLTDPGTPVLLLTASQLISGVKTLSLITNPSYTVQVQDSTADISTNFSQLQKNAGQISQIILTNSAPLALTAAQALSGAAVFSKVSNQTISVSVNDTAANVVSNIPALGADPQIVSVKVTDTAQNIAANLSALRNVPPARNLSVVVSDNCVNTLSFATNSSVSNLSVTYHLTDTAANVSSNLDHLNNLSGLSSISVSDGASLSLSVAQTLDDTRALAAISGSYTINVEDSVANIKNSLTVLSADSMVSSITVVDTAANIAAAIGTLAGNPLITGFTESDNTGGGTSSPVVMSTAPSTVGHGQAVQIGSVSSSSGSPLSLVVTQAPSYGSLSLSNGIVSYKAATSVPSAGAADSFSYEVQDGAGHLSAPISATLQVDPGPTTTAAHLSVASNASINITSLIENSVRPGLAGDIETLTSVKATSGTAALSAGVADYTAPASGTDLINYSVADQYGDNAIGTVSVTVMNAAPATAPTITGTVGGKTTTSEAPVTPFSKAVIGDANPGATDSLSINLHGSGTLADGSGFSGLIAGSSAGTYSLSGSAASITAELDAMVFKPGAGPANTSYSTSFTLYVASSAGTSASDNTTTVTDVDPAVAPTIRGTKAGQTTTSEAPVSPFANVTISDANNAATDSLYISAYGSGTLTDGSGFSGLTAGSSPGTYSLSGSTASITAEFDALVFKPGAGPANTSYSTSFTLYVASSTGTSASDNTTTVTDVDPAVAPTITGTVVGQTTTAEQAIKPFSGVTIADGNTGSTETLTITVGGSGGTLTDGTGFSKLAAGGTAGTYSLSGSAAAVTSELDALVFKPAAAPPNGTAASTFKLVDSSSAGTSVSDTTTTVIDRNPFGPDVGTPYAPPTGSDTLSCDGTYPFDPTVTGQHTITFQAGVDSNVQVDVTNYGSRSYGDIFKYARADGNVSIRDTSGASDVLEFTDLKSTDVTFTPVYSTYETSGTGWSSLAITVATTGKTVTVDNWSRTDAAYGPQTLIFADGVTLTRAQILAAEPNQTPSAAQYRFDGAYTTTHLTGQYGGAPVADVWFDKNNDTVYAASGVNTYHYASTNGTTQIFDTTAQQGVLSLSDLNATDVTLSRTGTSLADLLVKVNATGKTIDVAGQFTNHGIGSLVFANTTKMTAAQIAAATALAPTIKGTIANQATTSETAVKPFSGVTIADGNAGATETLTITVGGSGGTLTDGSGFSGLKSSMAGVYTLSGSAAAVTSELDALVFKPTAGAVNTSSTSTFKLTDASSAGTSVTDTTTTVVNSDPASAPIVIKNTNGIWATVNTTNSTISLINAQAAIHGGGNMIGTDSNGDTFGLYDTNGAYDTVNGSNNLIYLNNAQSKVVGGNNTIVYDTSSNDLAVLSGTNGNWDVVNAAHGTITLNGAQAAIHGGRNTIGTDPNGDTFGLYDTAGTYDTVNGSNNTITLNRAQAAIHGGGNTIGTDSSGDTFSLYDTNGAYDTVNGSNNLINLNNAQSKFVGGNNTIVYDTSSNDLAVLSGTNGNWDVVNATHGTITLNGAQAAIHGGGNTIGTDSNGDIFGLYDTGSAYDTVNGSNNTIYLNNAQSVIVGGNNTIDFDTSGNDVATISGTNGNWDVVNATSGIVHVSNAQTTVVGGSDSIYLDGGQANIQGDKNTIYGSGQHIVSISGQNDVLYENQGSTTVSITDLGHALTIAIGSSTQTDSITGFGKTDTTGVIDFKNGAGGFAAVSNVLNALHSDGHGGTLLSLGSTGSIDFLSTPQANLHASNFKIG